MTNVFVRIIMAAILGTFDYPCCKCNICGIENVMLFIVINMCFTQSVHVYIAFMCSVYI